MLIGIVIKCFVKLFTSYSQAISSLPASGVRVITGLFSDKKKYRNRLNYIFENRAI